MKKIVFNELANDSFAFFDENETEFVSFNGVEIFYDVKEFENSFTESEGLKLEDFKRLIPSRLYRLADMISPRWPKWLPTWEEVDSFIDNVENIDEDEESLISITKKLFKNEVKVKIEGIDMSLTYNEVKVKKLIGSPFYGLVGFVFYEGQTSGLEGLIEDFIDSVEDFFDRGIEKEFVELP